MNESQETLFVLVRMKGGGEFVLMRDKINELWNLLP